MTRPSFRAYTRVLRRRPDFWGGVLVLVLACVSDGLHEGPLAAGRDLAAGIALLGLVFPWWRRRVSRKPHLYTWGHPELLDEPDVIGDAPVLAVEPGSNVRTVD